MGIRLFKILSCIDFYFQIDSNRCIPSPNCALTVKSKGISQEDTRRDICAWDAFALEEEVCFTALRSLKKYDPGVQRGIEYHIMYCKFAPMQKYEF